MADALAFCTAVLLVLVGVAYHACVTPPNRAPSAVERSKAPRDPLGTRLIRRSQVFNQIVLWTAILTETAHDFAAQHPTHALTPLFLALVPAARTPRGLTPTLLLGITLVLAGAALRTASYRALGRLFTFELALRHAHTLVTSGPYAYVRHPGYAGAVLAHTGMLLCVYVCGGAWWATGTGRAAGAVVLAGVGYVMAGFAPRTGIEDRMLRKQFGREWEEWAKRVKWRIVPGVF